MEHTPGPWRQVGHTIWAGEPNTTNGPIAEASGTTSEEVEANARLIAAAPELLSACEEALITTTERCKIERINPDASPTVLCLRTAIKAARKS